MDNIETKNPAPAVHPVPRPMPASCCPPYSRLQLPPGRWRSWLGNRYVLAAAGLAVLGSGLALGWSWLAAAGIAPLIVSTAPCLVICAVGACAMCRRSPGGAASSPPPAEAPPPVSRE
jgi:hypothetical protein